MEDVWFSAVSQHWREYMTTRMHPTGLDGCSTSPPFLHRSVSYFCVLTNNITIPQLTCPQQWMLVILSHHFIVFQWRCVNVLCRLIFGALSTNTKVPTSSSVLQKKGKKSCTKIIKMNEQHYILEERQIFLTLGWTVTLTRMIFLYNTELWRSREEVWMTNL